jgi:hypothetical protein
MSKVAAASAEVSAATKIAAPPKVSTAATEISTAGIAEIGTAPITKIGAAATIPGIAPRAAGIVAVVRAG